MYIQAMHGHDCEAGGHDEAVAPQRSLEQAQSGGVSGHEGKQCYC